MPTRNCAQCAEPFAAIRRTKRFCSDLCRVRASRGIKAAAQVGVTAATLGVTDEPVSVTAQASAVVVVTARSPDPACEPETTATDGGDQAGHVADDQALLPDLIALRTALWDMLQAQRQQMVDGRDPRSAPAMLAKEIRAIDERIHELEARDKSEADPIEQLARARAERIAAT